MPWIYEAEVPHVCDIPRIRGGQITDRMMVHGDVWMCPKCLALWELRRNQFNRFTWKRGGLWLAWKHRKTVDSFRSGGVL